MTAPTRPRRSVLYMPASNPRALEKARGLPADTLVFDLEDAVAPDQKLIARSSALSTVAAGGYGAREILIRVNALDTAWGPDDIAAVARSGAHGMILPKVNSLRDIQETVRLMDRAGAPASLLLWAMMETPRGILAVAEIASANDHLPKPRLAGLIVGTADLAKELRCAQPTDRAPMLHALQLCVLAARAFGLKIIDGVHFDLEDEAGLAAVCRQGRELGFDGKSLIHPKQVAVANAAFAPTPEQIDRARRTVAAHRAARAEGKEVTVLDGRMIEALHVVEAERLLAEAEAIAALETAAP